MWLFTKAGFFSVVKGEHGDSYAIRARAKRHLKALIALLPEALDERLIDSVSGTDYPHRIYVNKRTLGKVLGLLGDEIDYGNFKRAIGTRDAAYSSAACAVWAVMAKMERRGA